MGRGLFVILFTLIFFVSCAKPLYVARDRPVEYVSKEFHGVSEEDVFHAVRWALRMTQYPVKRVDNENRTIITSWVPVKADSHYIELFNRKDYGTTASYHRLIIRIFPIDGLVRIEVGSQVKSIMTYLKSTKSQEKLVLEKISDALRSEDIRVTNVGIQE